MNFEEQMIKSELINGIYYYYREFTRYSVSRCQVKAKETLRKIFKGEKLSKFENEVYRVFLDDIKKLKDFLNDY